MSHEKAKNSNYEEYAGLDEVDMDDITRFVKASRVAQESAASGSDEPVAPEIPAETQALIDAFKARHSGAETAEVRAERSRRLAARAISLRNRGHGG